MVYIITAFILFSFSARAYDVATVQHCTSEIGKDGRPCEAEAVGIEYLLCPQKPGYACSQCEEPLVKKVTSLFDQVPKTELTLEKFLGKLPQSIRSGAIFMGKSGSLHEASPDSPRVILKSPDSDVIVSYGTGPHLQGHNLVEAVIWNGKDGRFEAYELDFSRRTVTKNPSSCVQCHGDPFRPKWDSRPFWTGEIPFYPSKVLSKSPDFNKLIEFTKRIEDRAPKNSRFNIIVPTSSSNELELAKKNKPWIVGKSLPGKTAFTGFGPASNMESQLNYKNLCSINNELKKSRDFDWIKHVLVAGPNCDISDFLPNGYREKAEKYYEALYKKYGANAVSKDTQARADESLNNRLSSQVNFYMSAYGLTKEQAKKEIEDINFSFWPKSPTGLFSREQAKDKILQYRALFRYILEPNGFNVYNMSLSTDPADYDFGFRLEYIKYLNEYTDIRDLSCEELKEHFQKKVNPSVVKPLPLCDESRTFPVIEPRFTQEIAQLKFEILREEAGKIFSKHKCNSCHSSYDFQYYFVPHIPFNNLDRLEEKIKDNVSLGKNLLSKVKRNKNVRGHMPLQGENLDREELAILDMYVNGIINESRPDSGFRVIDISE